MSENQEFEMNEGLDSMAVIPGQGNSAEAVAPAHKHMAPIGDSIDSKTYLLGEVPQSYLVDPCAFLPLNSDRLMSSVNMAEKLLHEIGCLIEDEVLAIEQRQSRVSVWEGRIEKNKADIRKNEFQIKQNSSDALNNKKNRDYWLGRAEEVEIDYTRAAVSNRLQDWSWLIKKYGLKNADGSSIDAQIQCVDELCNGGIKNLSSEYRRTGQNYESARQEKESETNCLLGENAKFLNTNDKLLNYISSSYTSEIEPLQDGVLLYKDLGVKLKSISQDDRATYGDLRAWAETFLSEFIKVNSRVPQSVVTHFRRLTSIPLPPEYG